MITASCLLLSAFAALSVGAAPLEFPTPEEYAQLAQLNAVRAAGYTCPNGEVFAPNPIPLKWDCALWRASRAHCADMTKNNFFDHEGSDGSTPGDRARRFGLQSFSNENISAGRQTSEEVIQAWLESWSGHCNGMLNPESRTMGAAYAFDPLTQYWSYWTQMTGFAEPNPELQDCMNEDGSLPQPLPTPPPTAFPTIAGNAVATADEFMDFQPTSWEMELLHLLNVERARGNQEECWGEFYTDLEPLVWNCGLFKAVRHHMWDGKTNDKYSRTGADGKTIIDRSRDYEVPYSCSDFKFSGGKNDPDMTPQRIVERLVSCCCWAVYGPEFKSFGAAHASFDTVQDRFPYTAWWAAFNRHVPPAEIQTCGGGEAPVTAPTHSPTDPVPEPTPAPTELVPEPTPAPTEPVPEPTPAPVEQPVEEPTEAPAPLICADYAAKKECKKQADCCWKKSACKDKATVCPKQGTFDKCEKYGCTWDAVAEACDWIDV